MHTQHTLTHTHIHTHTPGPVETITCTLTRVPPLLCSVPLQEPAVQPSLQPPQPGPSVGMTVIAEYEFTPLSAQDLELRRDEEYTILEMSDVNWWRARDKYGWAVRSGVRHSVCVCVCVCVHVHGRTQSNPNRVTARRWSMINVYVIKNKLQITARECSAVHYWSANQPSDERILMQHFRGTELNFVLLTFWIHMCIYLFLNVLLSFNCSRH